MLESRPAKRAHGLEDVRMRAKVNIVDLESILFASQFAEPVHELLRKAFVFVSNIASL